MKRALLFVFTLLPFLSYAQTNYQRGYFFSNTGDSIPGFIDYKEREHNPSSFTFKFKIDGPSKTYEINDCKAFGLVGLETYERYAVNVSQSQDALSQLSVGRDSTSIRDTVFLKVIQAGKKVTFYEYSDQLKKRFYVKELNDSQPDELIYSTYKVDETGTFTEYNKYIRQLTALLLKSNKLTPESQSMLGSLRYTKTSILGIVSFLNDQQIGKGPSSTRFFIGAALNTSQASYTGTSVFNGPGSTNKTSNAPMLIVGVDLFTNPKIGRVVYRAELAFTSAQSEIFARNTDPTVEYKTHAFKSYGLIITPQIIWNVYNSNPFKAFIGAGAAVNYAKYTDNATTTKWRDVTELYVQKDHTKLNDLFFSPQASAGFVLKNRYEIFGNYMFKGSMTDYINYTVAMTRMNLGIKYLFD